MCGVAGFTGKSNRALLIRMAESLRHRGPDGDGFYTDDRVNLGMRRLAIVDLQSGDQPVFSEDRNVVVIQNGEIYNHRFLRRELEKKGHRFQSDHSDTEVIPHLYEEYGEDWVQHVNGMFAVVIWDQKKKKLFLYRDRIGKKPIYYALKDGKLIFASEIKAVLLHPTVSREIDFSALYHYFGLKNISAPRTVYQDIRELLPGHSLCWQEGHVEIKSYWKLDFSRELKISEEEAAGEILRILEDAIRLRIDCDVPFGAYLSGGIDSSSVATLMSRFASKPLQTFCLVYEEEGGGPWKGKQADRSFSREMAKRLGTHHYEFVLTPKFFSEKLPAVLRAFDEPFSGTVSTYFLSILIREHVKVALSGDGADELFGSYLPHRLAFAVQSYNQLVAKQKSRFEDLTEGEKLSLQPFNTPDQYAFLRQVADNDLATWRTRVNVFTPEELKELLDPAILREVPPLEQNFYASLSRGLTAQDELNRVLEMDQKELLPNQVLPFVDRLSMAHSIEVRVPYLDYRLIEFANALPGRMKIREEITKRIHKMAMEKILPQDIIERPKEGFVQPNYSWMHDSLKDWTLECLGCLPRSLFRFSYLDNLISRFKAGDRSLNAKIWNLSCFSLWWQQRS